MYLKEIVTSYEEEITRLLRSKKPLYVTGLSDKMQMLHSKQTCANVEADQEIDHSVKALKDFSLSDLLEVNAIARCGQCRSKSVSSIYAAQNLYVSALEPLRTLSSTESIAAFSMYAFQRINSNFGTRSSTVARASKLKKFLGKAENPGPDLAKEAFYGTYALWLSLIRKELPKEVEVSDSEVYIILDINLLCTKSGRRVEELDIKIVPGHVRSGTVLVRTTFTTAAEFGSDLSHVFPVVHHINQFQIEETAYALMRDGMDSVSAFVSAISLES